MRTLSAKGALAITSISMVTLGIVTAGIGPTLPNLATNTATSLATVGAVLSALFLGGLLTQLLGGPLNDRIGERPVMLVGLLLMACGVSGIALSQNLVLLVLSAVVAGLGRGAMGITSNLLIAKVFETRSAAALNVLNVFYGVGAVAGPAIAGFGLRTWNSALIVMWVSVALLLVQVPLVMRLGSAPDLPRRREAGAALSNPLRSPILWVYGAISLIYVGCESGVGGWLTTYLEQTLPIDAAAAAWMTGTLWIALTAGRAIAAYVGTRLRAATLLLGSLVGSLLGSILLVASVGHAVPTVLAVAVLGLFFGPIFPTMLAMVTQHFRHAPGTAASITSALGGLGGTVLPWAQGVLLDRRGPVASMAMIIAATAGMLVLDLVRRVMVKQTQDPAPATPR